MNFLSVSRTCVNCNCLQFYLQWKNLRLFWFITNVVWFYSVLDETSNLNIVHRSGKTKGRSFYFFVHVSKALSRTFLGCVWWLGVYTVVVPSCSKFQYQTYLYRNLFINFFFIFIQDSLFSSQGELLSIRVLRRRS